LLLSDGLLVLFFEFLSVVLDLIIIRFFLGPELLERIDVLNAISDLVFEVVESLGDLHLFLELIHHLNNDLPLGFDQIQVASGIRVVMQLTA
jgi:hypothetical protein